MTFTELNEMTRDDLMAIDFALIALARFEHKDTKNTVHADRATKALNRIAVRYGLAVEEA
jgi:hypothetical protein